MHPGPPHHRVLDTVHAPIIAQCLAAAAPYPPLDHTYHRHHHHPVHCWYQTHHQRHSTPALLDLHCPCLASPWPADPSFGRPPDPMRGSGGNPRGSTPSDGGNGGGAPDSPSSSGGGSSPNHGQAASYLSRLDSAAMAMETDGGHVSTSGRGRTGGATTPTGGAGGPYAARPSSQEQSSRYVSTLCRASSMGLGQGCFKWWCDEAPLSVSRQGDLDLLAQPIPRTRLHMHLALEGPVEQVLPD